MKESTIGDHAVVVGGSMAGLLVARVLGDHFRQVTIVDRDTFPDQPSSRKGVPQSFHLHVLIPGGLEELERSFPGLENEMLALDAVTVRWPKDILWMNSAGWSARFEGRHRLCCSSRGLLEWVIRKQVLSVDNIEPLEGHEVVGLNLGTDGVTVVGVELRKRASGPTGVPTNALTADFVVDASGRTSQAPAWLEAAGFGRPAETRIDSFLGYASRLYARPDDSLHDWRAIYLQANPPNAARMGGLFPIEGGRWIVMLGGAGRDYPPTDEAGFLDFASSLRSRVLYEAIRNAEPLTPIRGYRRTDNERRRFERMSPWPEGFAVVGDAACAFNPIYGQGMTVAAQTAAALERALRRRSLSGRGFSRRLQRTVGSSNAAAWLIATGEDMRYPTTAGARPSLRIRLMHRYLDRVLTVANTDRTVSGAFIDALSLIKRPTSLFKPRIVAAALRGSPGERHGDGIWPRPEPAAVSAGSPGRS
jgi:2-polyprenyl-6-methoxyphenol hydroxylase-like FAD-dependent oxidoreductase